MINTCPKCNSVLQKENICVICGWKNEFSPNIKDFFKNESERIRKEFICSKDYEPYEGWFEYFPDEFIKFLD